MRTCLQRGRVVLCTQFACQQTRSNLPRRRAEDCAPYRMRAWQESSFRSSNENQNSVHFQCDFRSVWVEDLFYYLIQNCDSVGSTRGGAIRQALFCAPFAYQQRCPGLLRRRARSDAPAGRQIRQQELTEAGSPAVIRSERDQRIHETGNHIIGYVIGIKGTATEQNLGRA